MRFNVECFLMRNAECVLMQNAERNLSAECGVRSAERLHFISLRSQGMNLNAKCKVQNAEWASLHFIPFTWFYLSAK